MAKLINYFLKKQTFRQIFLIFARENKDILSKYRLNTNETNHTHHRRSTFRQKHLCGKAGTRALSHSRLSCHSTHLDEEFRQRVIRHQERRGPEWTNIEEEKELSRHRLEGRVVLIDCITLWCTNFFFRPAFRYRPGTCRSKGGVRPLHGTRRNLHLCNQ